MLELKDQTKCVKLRIYLNSDNSLLIKIVKGKCNDIFIEPNDFKSQKELSNYDNILNQITEFLELSITDKFDIIHYLDDLELRDVEFIKSSGRDSLSILEHNNSIELEFFDEFEGFTHPISFNKSELTNLIDVLVKYRDRLND